MNVERLGRAFTYKLDIHVDGQTREKTVHITETFNYLLGLYLKPRRTYDDDGRRYLVYAGEVDHRRITVIWRETEGWEKAGLPLQRCGNAISLERQVQIAIGNLLVVKVLLGFTIHELFFALAALIGTGLIFAGVTRWCGMAKLIARMPWNRGVDCTGQANS